MRALVVAAAVAFGVGMAIAAWAHEPSGADSAAVSADTGAMASGSGAAAGAPGASGEPRPPYKMPPFWKAATDHMHNKLVHFPIVLTLVAAALLIVARRRPELESVAFWMVWIAALSVIPAYFSGQAQEEEFVGKPKEWLGELHEKVGITIGVTQALWVLMLLKANTRRFAWTVGILLAVLVLTAGFLGGLLAHGRSG